MAKNVHNVFKDPKTNFGNIPPPKKHRNPMLFEPHLYKIKLAVQISHCDFFREQCWVRGTDRYWVNSWNLQNAYLGFLIILHVWFQPHCSIWKGDILHGTNLKKKSEKNFFQVVMCCKVAEKLKLSKNTSRTPTKSTWQISTFFLNPTFSWLGGLHF